MTVEEYIENIDSSMKNIVLKLREIVKASSSELTEEIKWNVPTYSINKNICSIMAHKNHVNFMIFQGAKIESAEVLEGNGKTMRRIKYTDSKQIDTSELNKYIKQAIELDKDL